MPDEAPHTTPATRPPDPDPAPPRLALRPHEAAAALGIGTRKLWELTNRGEIPVVRIGKALRYPVADLQAWLSARAKGGER